MLVSSERREVSGEGGGGDAVWWAALQRADGVGAATMLRLARAFGSPKAAVEAPPEDLRGRGGLTQDQAAQVGRAGEEIDALRAQLDAFTADGIRFVDIEDDGYPAALLDLRGPPPLLSVRGDLVPQDARAVAVVGTRRPDAEGARFARTIARELAERGFTIVSGLARGIDTAAHRGALDSASGRTIAVLGSGLMRIYPPENRSLAEAISRRGCLMSEVLPDTPVQRRLLLARNRIQAALSRAVIVVQAHRECGSLVTARQAEQCCRPLYAVPWPEHPFSEGWGSLQRLGARALQQAFDFDRLAAEIDAAPLTSPQRRLL